jgi:hypothetical protein
MNKPFRNYDGFVIRQKGTFCLLVVMQLANCIKSKYDSNIVFDFYYTECPKSAAYH